MITDTRTDQPRRRYICACCDAQFSGPVVDLDPSKVVYCEPCYQGLISDGLVEADSRS